MKLAMNILNSKDSHECIHHSRILPVIPTVVMSLRTHSALAEICVRLEDEELPQCTWQFLAVDFEWGIYFNLREWPMSKELEKQRENPVTGIHHIGKL